MALDLPSLKAQCVVDFDHDDALLTRLLAAARRHVEGQLGYALDDDGQLPDGIPADLEHAVMMIAAHWYENRESVLVGVSAQDLPAGAGDIIANHRSYSFG